LPGDKPVVYVKAGANGGDGTKAKPHGTIGEAVKGAKAGTVVAIGKGMYPEAVAVGAGRDVTLWGACTAGVTILGPEGSFPDATVKAAGSKSSPSKLQARNLSVTGKRPGILFLHAIGALDGVVVKETQDVATHLEGSQVTLRAVVVRDTRSDPVPKNFGFGMNCIGGSHVQIERSFFHRNREVGLYAAEAGTSLELKGVIVQETRSRESSGTLGRGLNCQEGAAVKVESSLFLKNREIGVAAAGKGTSVALKDTAVRDTQGRESDGYAGWGLNGQEGARVEVERVFLLENRQIGVFAIGKGTSVKLVDSVVQDTRSGDASKDLGRGLNGQGAAQVEVERSLFLRNRDAGVFVNGKGTSLTMKDAVVQDTKGRESDGNEGKGLECQGEAMATVERSIFSNNHTFGVYASGEATSLKLTDVVIKSTQSQESTRRFGRGINLQFGAKMTVERALLDQNRDVGLFAIGQGTSASLTDTILQNTDPQESNGEYGVGIAASSGASLSLLRSHLRSNSVAGLLLQSSSSASLSSVWITDTRKGNFTPVDDEGLFLDKPIQNVADGIIVLDGSSLSTDDVLVSSNDRAALLFVQSGGMLKDTRAVGHRYGLVLRSEANPTYDETCSFEENETPLLPDGDLPVPNAPLPTIEPSNPLKP
jgi:hypothetical protein